MKRFYVEKCSEQGFPFLSSVWAIRDSHSGWGKDMCIETDKTRAGARRKASRLERHFGPDTTFRNQNPCDYTWCPDCEDCPITYEELARWGVCSDCFDGLGKAPDVTAPDVAT